MRKSTQERYAYWQEIMEKFTKSELSQVSFCKSNNISYYQFKYYYHRLKQRDKVGVSTGLPVGFAPVNVSPSASLLTSQPSRIHLRLRNQLVLEFKEDIQPGWLSTLVKELNRC